MRLKRSNLNDRIKEAENPEPQPDKKRGAKLFEGV